MTQEISLRQTILCTNSTSTYFRCIPSKIHICFAFYIIFSTKSFSVLDCITCHIFTHVWFLKYFKVLFLNFFSNPYYTLRSVISYLIQIEIIWPDFFIDLDYKLILTIDFILYGFTWNDLLSKRTIGSKSSNDHDLLRFPSCIPYISRENK